ncbi:MAG: Glutathione peroxidase family protein, partial [Proteobacteria bacterium]|nr:Glutathione peroxidase family protein [Pseudomonadota bacterium]
MTASLFDLPLTTLSGEPTTLTPWLGKVLLIVNTASKCGLTPQYEGLVALHHRYKDRGLVVLGFPANDFAGQEPGTDAEIATFCSATFGVDFPMFSKIEVTGEGKHPLYAALIDAKPEARTVPGTDFRAALVGHGITPTEPPEVLWNFEKFLIGRDGAVLDRFSPDTSPEAGIIVEALEKTL